MRKTSANKNLGTLALPLAADHKDAYRQIRNYLAGRWIGATRDESLLEEVVKTLFCKLYLRRTIRNSTLNGSTDRKLKAHYEDALTQLQTLLPSSFSRRDGILLDEESLIYVDRMLDSADLDNPARDPIGDVYEAFTGSLVRGQEGQFFTPQNAVELLVSLVDPQPGERIIDPACGAGGFLSAAARHLRQQGDNTESIAMHIFGVDKDRYLSELAASHLSLVTLQPAQVFCADSLAWDNEDKNFPLTDGMGTFDVVLANPPFGARIVSASEEVQRGFDLGYRWTTSRNGTGNIYTRTATLSSATPQVLFMERCLQLLCPGGRMGIVVPESLISSRNYSYVVAYIRRHANIVAVVGMPESLFKTSGKGGTHTKTCLLLLQKKTTQDADVPLIFMAEAKWCGHDSRGKTIPYDDLPLITQRFAAWKKGIIEKANHLGYIVSPEQISDDALAPRYYNPDVTDSLSSLEETHEMVSVGNLMESGLLKITTGNEIGKLAYGTGDIPFVRTSDISNWEVKLDPKHGVSEEIYSAYASRQDVREGDILMVRDGTYLIGTCAYVTRYDTKILYQSHLYKLRITDTKKLSPFLLLALLSCQPVQDQIRAKRVTQDIIDSLGNRIRELVLPIPKNPQQRERITAMVKKAIEERIEARELARAACVEIVKSEPLSNTPIPSLVCDNFGRFVE
jgi:type I restriction enzyme M protein